MSELADRTRREGKRVRIEANEWASVALFEFPDGSGAERTETMNIDGPHIVWHPLTAESLQEQIRLWDAFDAGYPEVDA